MRDLEIRGAGDLLGAEQSGHVAALGFELYVEMLNEAVAELSGQARVRRAAGPGRRARRRVRPRHLHRGRGAQDRPPPADRARRARGRAARAARRDGGPLRADARAGREPVPDPGGEARARAGRGGLPRLPRRARDRRPGRRSRRPSCACSASLAETAVYTSARQEVALRTDGLDGALGLAAAIVAARRAA